MVTKKGSEFEDDAYTSKDCSAIATRSPCVSKQDLGASRIPCTIGRRWLIWKWTNEVRLNNEVKQLSISQRSMGRNLSSK
ncbi:hypothetical protein H5410_001474 [Solanum commersonii]|uniref:Uncharacterized protein n=1 Tax=Solanum commersonii TaxID=4109 RepID=A0A9J6AYV4_SOLCO|nr:hypothetical protein H5410_001474 [Solanum commersonii]